jgi:hypothetical protein
VPVALEDMLREEANTAGADTHGRWGEAVDVCAVQEVALKLLFGDAVGGLVVELSQQADVSDIGLLPKFRPKFRGFKTRLICVKGRPTLALPADESPAIAL